MKQTMEGKLTAHDKHQFELKLGYTLDPEIQCNKYDLELYFFIPKSLGINNTTYDKSLFFKDMQGYIRFKTPTFSFVQLIDPENNLSPLYQLRNKLKDGAPPKQMIAEIKMYACTLRVALRNSITQVRRLIRNKEINFVKDLVATMSSGLTACLVEFRKLGAELETPTVAEEIKTSYRHADEYLGIALDGLLNSLHNSIIDANLPEDITKELNGILIPIIKNEFEHRQKNGYASYSENSENELFLYRKSVLKKLVTNILFLQTHTEEALSHAKEMIFAVAAGVAMIIAAAITIWAGQRWGSTSLPFVLAIVIGYMAKDRIKDWCKLVFSKKMNRWLSDFKTDILDPATNSKIGVCRQAFSFVPEKKIPSEILAARRKNTPSDFWLPEDVFKYDKDISLKPAPIFKAHARLRDITDIIRFNVQQFLERMDEPYEIRRAIDPNTGETREFTCARVYHINMILKLEDSIKKMRLVLNQNGIRRIDEMK